MPTFTGKFEYLIDGKKVTQEQFQHLVDGKENDYDISIDNLRVIADKKGNEPFFLDEFLFPAKIEKIWLTNNTGGTVFEKVQDSALPPHPTKEQMNESFSDSFKRWSNILSNDTSVKFQILNLTDVDPVGVYNDIVGHSTRHKAGKETESTKIKEIESVSERHKWEVLDAVKKQLLRSGLFLSLEDSTLIFSALTIQELQPLVDRLENVGKKETEGKLHYELSWEFIEEMAKRMANNKSDKYPLYNWKKPLDIQSLKDAINRHHIEVMKGNYQDGDEILGHIVQYACNGMMLWEQLKNKQ